MRPYLYGAYELPDFLANVFGAMEMERHEQTDRRAAHVEMQVGDSVVVVEAGEIPTEHDTTEASVYVYVEDVDAVYKKALEAGAKSIHAPKDQHYGERSCGFSAYKNTWWVATYLNA